MLLFSLSGLSGNILNRHALPCIDGHTLRQRHDLRHIQNADKVIVDFKLLRLVPAGALRLMNDDLFNQLVYNGRGEFLDFRVFAHCPQKIGRAALVPLLRVDLRLQSGDFLFKRNLLVIVAFGNHHEPLVGELSACVVFVGFGEKAVQFGTAGQVRGVDKVEKEGEKWYNAGKEKAEGCVWEC